LRVAELFRERIGSPEQVISETIVKEVIAILGYPEEIATAEASTRNNLKEKNGRKKLYRNIDNKVLGGVCSGMAAYFNIDVVLVRVLFVISFICFSVANWLFFSKTIVDANN
jgi:phage shock protein PspC (stress-responsive transcriptional regulator)